jgi:urease accessory protein
MATAITTEALEPLALLRLLQLVSPALPIGAFNFSQGMEYAIEAGWVRDESAARDWILGLMRQGVGTLDIPLLARMHDAWAAGDAARVRDLSARLIACRETQELREEDRHLGRSLARVLYGIGLVEAESWQRSQEATLAAMFSMAAVHSGVPRGATCAGYLWAWCENQAIATVKLLPLGQTAGQRVLETLRVEIPPICHAALELDESDIGAATPGLCIASCHHETQYTRLFRS